MLLHQISRKPVVKSKFTFNPGPAMPQTAQWTCSASATAHGLRGIGLDVSEWDIVDLLGPLNITPQHGLMRGDGTVLAQKIREHYGLNVHNQWIGWEEALQIAGTRPMMLGGAVYYHWVSAIGSDGNFLYIANSALGYKGVWDRISRTQWGALGSWAAVIIELQ